MKPRILAATFLAVALAHSDAVAQTRRIEGQVRAGAANIANQPVSLHRVTNAGGNTIATDTTDGAGRFSFEFESPGGEVIHFVATRYENQLYIGETFRDVLPEGEYIVAVGPNATPINLGPAVASAQPPVDTEARRAGVAIILLVLSVSALLVFMVTRQRSSPARRLLVEIADLDNRNEAKQLDTYHQQRSELLRRLRETA